LLRVAARDHDERDAPDARPEIDEQAFARAREIREDQRVGVDPVATPSRRLLDDDAAAEDRVS